MNGDKGRARVKKPKKTPLGRRGVRVIVVVANSVSATAIGLWWIIVVVLTALIIVVISSSY